MAVDPICLCGDPQGQHKMRKGGCRAADCGCDRFEVDEQATAKAEAAAQAEQARVLTTVAEVCKEQGEAARAELATLGVNRVHNVQVAHAEALQLEQLRVRLSGQGRPTPHLDRVKADLARVEKERDDLAAELASTRTKLAESKYVRTVLGHQCLVHLEEKHQLLAALEQMQIDLIEARAATGWIVARDTGEGCEKCERPIQRGEAYVPPLPGVGLVEHVHCPDVVETAPAAAVLYAYDAWSCLVDGGCGARYTAATATTNHPCGQLTPVTVTITRRPEGHTA